MSQVLIDSANMAAIGDAIRYANGGSDEYLPEDMPAPIRALKKTLVQKSITQNGSYDPADDGADGYSEVTVNVQGGITPTGTISITANGIVDVTQYASANVNVPTGGIMTGTTPPTSDMGSDGDYYKQTFPLATGINFVEYLQSSGTQYIDTGIIADQGTDFYAKCYKTGDVHVFGVRTGSGTSATNALMVAISTDSIGASKTTSSINQSEYRYTASDPTEVETKSSLYSDGSYSAVSFFNGEAKNLRTPKQAAFQSNGSMVMFGARVNGTVNKSSSAKIYRLTIMQEHVPIADYLPCLDGNGIACMWDNVAQEYVYNDGTGDFAYGDPITPTPLEPLLYVKKEGAWEVLVQ